MYDLHSHILPNVDDGSRDVAESLTMLRESTRQGVTHLAATPHFYPDRTNPEEFLEKRRLSWEKLAPHLDSGMPQIKLGAEVHYFEGICLFNNILPLCLEGTNLLLLEMPLTPWSSRMLGVLTELNGRHDIRVLLAHFERYLVYQPTKMWDALLRNGIRLQADAGFFLERSTRHTALKMLKNGSIYILGSDCHNMSERKPNLGDAAEVIAAKLGGDALELLNMRGRELFDEMD